MSNFTEVSAIIEALKNKEDIKKIAYSGTHGTGKTTSCFNLATQCKLVCNNKSVHLITEVASESPFKINKSTTEESQTWIFNKQMLVELECCSKYKLVITDRTIVDNIGYTMVAGFNNLALGQIEFAKSFMHTYDKIFFRHTNHNNFHFEDGIRDGVDKDFRDKVQDKMIEIYHILSPYMKNKNVVEVI